MTDINIGAISEALNDKMDRDTNNKTRNIQFVIESFVDGTSGYRIWSDGYCEQWGFEPASTAVVKTILFLKVFRDNSYLITGGAVCSGGATIAGNSIAIVNATTTKIATSFQMQISASVAKYWKASGYLAEGQY